MQDDTVWPTHINHLPAVCVSAEANNTSPSVTASAVAELLFSKAAVDVALCVKLIFFFPCFIWRRGCIMPAVPLSPICQPSFQCPSPLPRCHRVNLLHILSHASHMSLERIYCTAHSQKAVKRACQGDKAPRAKTAGFPLGPLKKSHCGVLKGVNGVNSDTVYIQF